VFESAEIGHKLSKAQFKRAEPKLRQRLLALQYKLLDKGGFPVVILVNGVDGAGKGETVNLLNEWMDPRHIHTHAFGPLTDAEERAILKAGKHAKRGTFLANSVERIEQGATRWEELWLTRVAWLDLLDEREAEEAAEAAARAKGDEDDEGEEPDGHDAPHAMPFCIVHDFLPPSDNRTRRSAMRFMPSRSS